MTTTELKALLGKYAGLLLYPQTPNQEKGKLPFTKSYWRIAKMKESKVDEARIKAIKENIDMHIDALRKIKKDL